MSLFYYISNYEKYEYFTIRQTAEKPQNGGIFLQKRCKQTQNALPQSCPATLIPAIFLRNFTALFQNVERIFFDLHDSVRLIHPYAALKMQIETAVIEVDRSDRRDTVVAHEGFRMKKSRFVLKYAHT